MKIRKASISDLESILNVYDLAKKYMRKEGNFNQWKSNYPTIELLQNDILSKNLYVIYEEKNIYGVFMFHIGIDKTYLKIYNGNWLNNDEYGTIHRLASDGRKRDILKATIDFCKQNISNIRIDTHRDNKTMQKLLVKNKFVYCGIIYLADGSERLAYQFINNK